MSAPPSPVRHQSEATAFKKFGTVSEGTYVQWKIPDFFTMTDDYLSGGGIHSPELISPGGRWEIILRPESSTPEGEKKKLNIYVMSMASDRIDPKKTLSSYIGTERVDVCGGPPSELGAGSFAETRQMTADTQRDTISVWNAIAPFGLDDLERRKSELVPSDILTITLYCGDGEPDTPKADMQQLKGLQNLSANFQDLFVSKEKADATIKVKDKDFQVHKLVLMARSSVFSGMFGHDTSEEQTGVVKVPDCDPESFQDFLHHLYTGKFDRVTSSNVHHLYVTSDKYDVQSLKSFCIDRMIQNLTVEKVPDVAIFAERYGDAKFLSLVQDFFNRNLAEVISTSQWKTLLKEDSEFANRMLQNMAQKVRLVESEVV